MNSSKPHLGAYPIPAVRNGMTVEALCGLVVNAVQIADSWEDVIGQPWKQVLNSLNSCTECRRSLETLSAERPQDVKYVYAIVDRNSRLGQKLEARQQESA